jgi:hypothetical protein
VKRGARHSPGPRSRPSRPREVWPRGAPPGVPPSSDTLSVVLVSPSPYAFGMANLGFHAALRSFLGEEGVRCERAFLDRERRGAAKSYETGTPLSDFDVVAFSVSFEEGYFGVASVLAASRIPLRAVDRGEDDPIVVMGGVCAFLNPEPVADFMDAVLVGSAEALVPPFVASLRARPGARRALSRVPRAVRIRGLARIPGVYVPRLYEVERKEDGRIVGFRPSEGAPLPVRAAIDAASGRMAESLIVSDASYFGDMFLLEMSRGCARGCRFCATGHMHGSPRIGSASDIVAAVRAALPCTTRVGLVSATLGDHPEIREILAAMKELGVEANVGSLRVESVDRELAELLVGCGVRTATIAPEAVEPLRRIIGKPTTDGAVLEATPRDSRLRPFSPRRFCEGPKGDQGRGRGLGLRPQATDALPVVPDGGRAIHQRQDDRAPQGDRGEARPLLHGHGAARGEERGRPCPRGKGTLVRHRARRDRRRAVEGGAQAMRGRA